MNQMIMCSGDSVDVCGAPKEIKILPLGFVHSQKGDFLVDDESVDLIRKRFKERKVDMVIDYEHQTLKDVQAPAGGWIKDIYKGEDAIIAKVEWTPHAEEYLKNKEYRYLSPVLMVRNEDRKAAEIRSVALTNTPAIDGMFAIVNSADIGINDNQREETKMNLKEIAAMLGLADTATEEEVKKALGEVQEILKKQRQTDEKKEAAAQGAEKQGDDKVEMVANSTVLSLLGLKTDAKTEDVVTSIMSLKAGDAGIVAEVRELKKELEEKNADEFVKLALKEGKISAAQKEWAKTYALSDKEGFKQFLDKAPVVVPQGKMALTDAPTAGVQTAYDMEILKNCGISEEDAKKYFKED